jgi:hypothetical protein
MLFVQALKQSSRDITRCSQDNNASGYHSDGHVSGASSDNESGSVCSEMVGVTGEICVVNI